MIIKTDHDSVLYDTRTIGLEGSVTFILDPPQHEKDYREGFQLISEGDSAVFITDAYTFYMKKNKAPIPQGLKIESIIQVEVRILEIRTPEEHVQDMLAEKEKLEQGEFEEKKTLDKYMADSSISAQLISNGMYYIKIEEGKGLTPDSGRVALLNYRGTFLNGRCFDFFYESQPFEYLVGSEEQLIKGLEIGVKRMHEGEKAKFIIPSHLAFGSSGSSTGIVPPFTTVIYEVELLKVQ
jgi:FKBP-type peptidyl-prolyl cis-trans isomerase